MLSILRDRELGMINEHHAKNLFITQNIKYRSPEQFAFFRIREFTPDTILFLEKLTHHSLINLYLNTENIFSYEDHMIFKNSLRAQPLFLNGCLAFISKNFKLLALEEILKLINDYTLMCYIPIKDFHARYQSDNEFAQIVCARPDILNYLRERNREVRYEWNHPMLDLFVDDIGHYMRGMHL